MKKKRKKTKNLGNPIPGPGNWLVALSSLGLVLYTLVWAQLATTGLHYARLQEGFAEGTRTGQNLQQLLLEPKFEPIFEQHFDAFQALLPVVAMINRGELQSALEQLSKKNVPEHPLLRRLRGRLVELTERDAEHWANLPESTANPASTETKIHHESQTASIREAQRMLGKVLLELTRVVVPPSLVEAYDDLDTIVAPFGVELPELMIV